MPFASLHAVDSTPIRAHNSLPIMQGLGLAPARDAALDSAQRLSWAVDFALQSHANNAASANAGEALLIDAESLLLSAELRWDFSPAWRAAIKVGAVRHSAGALDSAIRAWHDALGLTQGDREALADDQFTIFYQQNGRQTQLAKASSGVSDTELSLAYQLQETDRWQLAVHGFINLPSGDEARLSGSRSSDYGLAIAWASNTAQRWGWHSSIGLNAIGDDQLFGINTQNAVWSVSSGVHFQAGEKWRWSAQLDGHDALFESQIPELSRPAWQLALGLEFADQWQVFITEDLTVNRAADFTLGLSWRSKF